MLEAQNREVFRIDGLAKSAERPFERRATLEPGAMHAVPGAVNIAMPHPLETHEHIALRLGALKLLGKAQWRVRPDQNKITGPFGLRPGRTREEDDAVAFVDHTARQPFQIRFRAAALGIAAANEADGELSHASGVSQPLLAVRRHNSCQSNAG